MSEITTAARESVATLWRGGANRPTFLPDGSGRLSDEEIRDRISLRLKHARDHQKAAGRANREVKAMREELKRRGLNKTSTSGLPQ